MSYQTKFNKLYKASKGFSLFEIVIVISIMGLILGVSSLVYNNFRAENNLNMATISIVEALRYTQSKSQAVSYDADWSVNLDSQKIEILKDGSIHEINELPKGILLSGISEIYFDKLTGKTSNIGEVIVSNNYGEKIILINENGKIEY